MKKYNLIRLEKPVKECGEIATLKKFDNKEELFLWLKEESIQRPLTQELFVPSGEFALVSADEKNNYVACELVLILENNRITGYRSALPADELELMRFYGLN